MSYATFRCEMFLVKYKERKQNIKKEMAVGKQHKFLLSDKYISQIYLQIHIYIIFKARYYVYNN